MGARKSWKNSGLGRTVSPLFLATLWPTCHRLASIPYHPKMIAHAVVAQVVEVVDGDTIKAIFTYSGGIPRRVNTLCDLILLSGFAKKTAKIDAPFVASVIKEFNLS